MVIWMSLKSENQIVQINIMYCLLILLMIRILRKGLLETKESSYQIEDPS